MMDDNILKKVEGALEVAKFSPRKPEEATIDVVLDQIQETIKGLQKAHDQMRDAWNDVAQHMMGIHRRINK